MYNISNVINSPIIQKMFGNCHIIEAMFVNSHT